MKARLANYFPAIVLAAILLLAAGARALLLSAALHNSQAMFTPDSQDYVELAGSLADRGDFARGHEPEIFRTPGYPLVSFPLSASADPGN